ncbi:MAG TPA: hypothetical protein EYP09_03175 [Anaerolineae bacterium]|nr:hypothetical protein [Anaerolineae bacterium]
MEEFLPILQEKYGDQLEIRFFEISDPHNYEVMVSLEERYGITEVGIPEIFIGQDFLVGEEDIRAHLEGLIQRYLASGGMDFPIEDLPTLTPTPAPASQPTIYLAYFFKQGCRECDRVSYDLNHLKKEYPNLIVESFDIDREMALSEALGKRYGVPEEKRLTAPAIFIGEDYLVGEQVNLAALSALVEKYATEGTTPPWEGVERSEAQTAIVVRFRSLGLLTVLGAGLIDGLNPCAFATIIFFISYLALSGRKGREILAVGMAFTLGVFLAYLLVGIGLWKFLQAIELLNPLGRWVYLATAFLCLILAFLSFLDALSARRGEIGEMKLSLPHTLRMRINAIIRRGRKTRAYVWMAFITGLVVSIIELACTGQVYLPTIMFVMGLPRLRTNAFFYLLLYNLSFILPLVVIFVLAFYGTTSQQLSHFLKTRAPAIKLAMAGLFLTLAAWLLKIALIP